MSYLGTTKIGKIFLGSTEIGKAYLGTNLVFKKGGSPTPTSDISYVRGGVGSYIDTGITPDNTTKVIVWARNFNPNALFLFGSRVAYGDTAFGIMSANNAYIGSLRNTYGNENVNFNDAFHLMSGYHKYELDAGELKVDDVILNASSSTFTGNANNIHLFGCNNNGTHLATTLPIDICACKIYKGGVLVRDFSPVSSPSVGLFDAVSGNVFTNAGAGSFTYGTFNTNAYTPIEYVECSGQQWFDSGIHATYSQKIVSCFMLTNSDTKWSYPWGLYDSVSSPNEACAIYFGNATASNSRAYTRLGSGSSSITIKTTSTSGYFKDKKLVSLKSDNTMSLYCNNSQEGTTKTASEMTSGFTSALTMAVGTHIGGGGSFDSSESLVGRLYYVGFDSSMSLVPAKVNGVAGMYDTYNDVFHPSTSGTAFIAGNEL